jgi:hypothetical protein
MRPVVAVVLCFGFAGFAFAQDVKKYESQDGAYAVLFPAKPTTQTTKANDTEVHIALVPRGTGAFLVIYSDLSAEDVKKEKPKDLLEKGMKGLVEQFKAKITESKDLEFGKAKYPARDVLAEKDATQIRVRIILAGNRVYQVMAIGPKDTVTGVEAKDFFDSFEITK